MLVLYDLTRLIARRKAKTPTGIDRVDFRYAKFFLNHKNIEVKFIINEGGTFFLIDDILAKTLLNILEKKWIDERSNLSDVFLDKLINLLFSYIRKQFQLKNNRKISSNNINLINYTDIMKKFLNAKPKKALGGKVTWINKLPKFIKIPLLFISGNVYYLYLKLKLTKKEDSFDNQEEQELFLDNRLKNLLISTSNIIYFNVSHHGIDNKNGFTDLITFGVKKLYFYIHDLIPIRFPEYVRENDDIKHENRLNTVLSFKESIILTNSEYSKKDILDFIKEKNINYENDIHVLHIGVEEHFIDKKNISQIENKFDFFKPYFLYVSTIEPRKNHLLLLNLWRKMIELSKNKDEIPKLILVGKRGWENQCIVAMLDRCKKINKYVIELNNLTDEELIVLYKNSQALLFPSYIEGWGMPIVESLTLNVPVICNNISVFKEAGQSIPEYVDVFDANKWLQIIKDYSNDSLIRKKQIERIKKFKTPTWEEHFKKLEKVLKS